MSRATCANQSPKLVRFYPNYLIESLVPKAPIIMSLIRITTMGEEPKDTYPHTFRHSLPSSVYRKWVSMILTENISRPSIQPDQ